MNSSVTRVYAAFLGLTLFLGLAIPVQASTVRIGVIGDSNTDEYRADDNRAGGTQYANTTLDWLELLVKYRGFSAGNWGTWGGPRRSGYEYNWALSGATTASMVGDGQHTGLAAQIAAGKIDYAIIFIGTNDFNTWNGTYAAIYDGTLTNAQVQAKVDSIVSNLTLSIDTLKNAGNAKIVFISFADPGVSTDFVSAFPNATQRQRVSTAITQINQRTSVIAANRGITYTDFNNFAVSLFSRVNSSGNLIVGSESISAVVHGDEPHHLQLAQGVGHAGTVGSGLLANFFLAQLNPLGASVTPFSDAEILGYSGIGAIPPTPTPAPAVCPTDINSDGLTDLSDYVILVQNFLKSPIVNARSDINKDGLVDISDYSLLVKNFLKQCQ